jgi:glycosyltransferase involved in cell wall biosynthesis
MKLSIIIPAFNESKLLPSTLASVREARAAVHRAGWSSEVIVCDNNSTDATAQIARANGADAVVFEAVNQIGRARNAGAAVATGDWFLFIDADSNPSYGLLSAMMDEILSGRVLAGGSTVTMNSLDPRAKLGALAWTESGTGTSSQSRGQALPANGCSSRCRGSSLCGDLEPSKESRNKMDRMSLSTAEAAIARRIGRVFPVMYLQSRQGVGR